MKFNRWNATFQNKEYTVIESLDIPIQLRVLYEPNVMSTILANAEGYKYLMDIFLIMGSLKKSNTIIVIADNSRSFESFQSWYPGGEFHKGIILYDFGFTQIRGKELKKVLSMKRYAKESIIELEVPNHDFEKIDFYSLDNTLHVNEFGKWVMLGSNYTGFSYLARDAESFLDYDDDPEEHFAHEHTFFLTKMVDKLDFRYYFEL